MSAHTKTPKIAPAKMRPTLILTLTRFTKLALTAMALASSLLLTASLTHAQPPPDDDDSFPFAAIMQALTPVCSALTAVPASVVPAGVVQLALTCTNAPTSYEWRLNGTVLAASPTTLGALTTSAPAAAGPYTYSVIARNGNLPSLPATATINVTAAPITITPTLSVSPISAVAPASVTLSAAINAIALGVGESVTTLRYYQNNVVIATVPNPAGTAWTYPVTNLVAGSYAFRVEVATNLRPTAVVSANVTATITTPIVTIIPTLSVSPISAVAPASVTLSAAINAIALGVGESVTTLRYYQNNVVIATVPNPAGTAWTYPVTNLVAGSYAFRTEVATNLRPTPVASSPIGLTVIAAVATPAVIDQTFGFDWAYDANGYVRGLTYPDSTTVSYNPNALGETTTVTNASPGSYYASAIAYHPTGSVASFTYGNGLTHSQTLNARNMPWLRQDSGGALSDTYTYDANGNITGISDALAGATTSRTMGYDGLDRLTSANALSLWGNGSYTYDALDNLKISTIGSSSITRVYDQANNRLTTLQSNAGTSTAITYDLQGNVNLRGSQAFTFDQANRLASTAGKALYRYDGTGRRVAVIAADGVTTLQIYSKAGQLLYGKVVSAAGSSASDSATRYVYLGQRLIAETKTTSAGAVTRYVHTDGLGSPVAHTSAAGVVLDRSRYEPYGANVAGAGNTNPVGIGFTGHVNDVDTGLVYMQQRYYDPVAGRFLSLDQVLTDTATGGSFNRYDYAANNPYKFVDPDGQAPSPVDIFATSFSGGEFLAAVVLQQWGKATGNAALAQVAGEAIAPTAIALAQDAAGLVNPVPGASAASKVARAEVKAVEIGSKVEKGAAPAIKWGAQEKHFPGHNSYTPGRSTMTSDPTKLAEKAGTGQQVGTAAVGTAGSKERVDFGGKIGTYIDQTGNASPTTKGIIHYSKEGIHIVPARPQ